jgi:hypothetical protein
MMNGVLLLVLLQGFGGTVYVDGRACRMNRSVDRLIVMTDSGARVRVIASGSTPFTLDGARIDAGDLRPGDAISAVGRRSDGGVVEAEAVDVRPRLADTIFEALVPRKTLIGRFAVREAQTEFFSFDMGGMNYIRVDARSAYGPRGRVRVGTLRSGDLLELDGKWDGRDVFRASSINVMTDYEPPGCRVKMSPEDAAAETAFLGK